MPVTLSIVYETVNFFKYLQTTNTLSVLFNKVWLQLVSEQGFELKQLHHLLKELLIFYALRLNKDWELAEMWTLWTPIKTLKQCHYKALRGNSNLLLIVTVISDSCRNTMPPQKDASTSISLTHSSEVLQRTRTHSGYVSKTEDKS